MLHKLFENLGLTSKEARIYLATLEIGSNPVSAIAVRAKLNRVTTYDILEKLVKKGMVSFAIKRRIKYFTAVDPEILVTEFKKRAGELESALPDLKKLHGETVHSKVRYFEGAEGIKNVYADTLTSTTEILNFCNSREVRQFWPNYDHEYVNERVNKNIRLRGISPDDEHGRRVQELDGETNREIRLVPTGQYPFTNEIHIYDNKVAIISFKDNLIGMIIESEDIADTQRAIFEMVWSFAQKPMSYNTETFTSEAEMNLRKAAGLKKKSIPEPTTEDQVSMFGE